MNEAYRQLEKADCLRFLSDIQLSPNTVAAVAELDIIPCLQDDERFMSGVFYGLHQDVGDDLMDFRSFRNSLGKGSLQIVIDKQTGKLYADVDAWSPYADVVGFFGHTGEVLRNWWRRITA